MLIGSHFIHSWVVVGTLAIVAATALPPSVGEEECLGWCRHFELYHKSMLQLVLAWNRIKKERKTKNRKPFFSLFSARGSRRR